MSNVAYFGNGLTGVACKCEIYLLTISLLDCVSLRALVIDTTTEDKRKVEKDENPTVL